MKKESILFLANYDSSQVGLYKSIEDKLTEKGCKFSSMVSQREFRFDVGESRIVILKRSCWNDNSRGMRFSKIFYTRDFMKNYKELFYNVFAPSLCGSGEIEEVDGWSTFDEVAEKAVSMVRGNWFRAIAYKAKKLLKK